MLCAGNQGFQFALVSPRYEFIWPAQLAIADTVIVTRLNMGQRVPVCIEATLGYLVSAGIKYLQVNHTWNALTQTVIMGVHSDVSQLDYGLNVIISRLERNQNAGV